MGLFDSNHSVLNPQSPEAAGIAALAWILFIGSAIIFVMVMALAAHALRARPAWLARRETIVLGGIAFPTVILFALLVYSLTQAGAMVVEDRAALRIEVTGHQWWWRVRYLDAAGQPDFETANEIRIPVGTRVELALASDDVLHSVWVPSLAGKLDMVPGRVNRLQLSADRPGVFRGQCAEYCGGPHAQMALYVVAALPAEFETWRAVQRRPAATDDRTFATTCAVCHMVRGTEARGTLGPDLTHVGSRLGIAAGTLPVNAETLARWIASSQHVKPGNLMPSFDALDAGSIGALATYLESLK